MAIVINTSINNYANVHNECVFTVYESTKANDPVNYVDYKYICDVYVDAALVARLRAVPHPVNKRGIFEVGSVIKDYMPQLTVGVQHEVRKAYQLKFGEEYNGTIYTNVLVDSTRYVYNSYFFPQLINGGTALYSNAKGYKTDRNLNNLYVSETDGTAYYLPFYTNATNTTIQWAVYLLVGLSVAGNITITSSLHEIGYIDISKQGFASLSGENVNNIDYATLTYNSVTYRINYKCFPKFKTYRLTFLNRYGAYESFDFMLASKKSLEISRKKYETSPYNIDNSGIILFKRNNAIGTQSTYSVKNSYKIKLTTDFLTDAEFEWLSQLVSSPEIYVADLFGLSEGLSRINPNINNYEVKTHTVHGLQVLELEFDFDYYNTHQL